ncbi:MAG: hypothetical protein GYB65_14535 [Chloroflexi bacterium]|nr:hypothetical protein [Chloroflexota bacterium]
MTSAAAWDIFLRTVHGETAEQVPVAVGMDCVFLPDWAGLHMLDYFLYPERWLAAQLRLMARFPEVVFLPGLWVEYGMANEPSAFGVPVVWHADQPPSLRHLDLPPGTWDTLPVPDPHTDGLMPLVLRRYWNLEHGGDLPDPHRVRFVAARGPFAIAGHVLGLTRFLEATAAEPDAAHAALEVFTETTIRFLRAQLDCLRDPLGVMVLDDVVGLLSPRLFQKLAQPFLARIFAAFEGLVRIYHNDTPCKHLAPHIGALDFEMWHFSHEMNIAGVRAAVGDKVLMGNVAPVTLMQYGLPEQVEAAGRACITGAGGRLVLAPGGGTNAGTPDANIDALVRAVGEI